MRPMMRPIRVHSALKSRAGWSRRDIGWAVFGCAALAVLGVALGALMAREKPAAPPLQAQNVSREGSILFVPGAGKLCRQQTIDNSTGRIGEARLVPCTQDDSARQVEAFRDGFQRK